MRPERNYGVRLTCRVEHLIINGVPQWHGIVTQVDLVEGNGKELGTFKENKN